MCHPEAVPVEVDAAAAEEKRQRKAAKAAKRAAKLAAAAPAEAEAAVEPEALDEDEAKRQRKVAKRAKEAAAAVTTEAEAAVEKEAVEEDEEAKRQRKAAKRAAKAAAAAAVTEPTEEATEEPPAKKAKSGTAEPLPEAPVSEEAAVTERKFDNELTVFVRGLPFSSTEEVIRKDFEECGEIVMFKLPLNDEYKPKGIAFIKYATQAGFDAALKFDGTDYGGRTLGVAKAGEGGKGKGKDGKGKDGKGKGKEGKGERDNTNTVFVRGLPWSVDEDSLKKDFAECGEIESLRMPKNEEGNPKGIAFIKFSTKEAMDAAMKFDSTDYGGRTIYVADAGEGGKGKDGKSKGKGKDGKDGKGKGKDGKGKGKGKKGDMSFEQMAAKNGAMIESTGEKTTFADSDDE